MKKHEIISVFFKKINTFNEILEDREYLGEISTRKPWATWNTGKSEHLKGKTNKKIVNEKSISESFQKYSDTDYQVTENNLESFMQIMAAEYERKIENEC